MRFLKGPTAELCVSETRLFQQDPYIIVLVPLCFFHLVWERPGGGIKPNKKTLEENFVRYGAKNEPESVTFNQLNKDKGLENCQKTSLASV